MLDFDIEREEIELECPRCGYINTRTEEHTSDLELCGKSVICCGRCGGYFLLCDDGDEEFIV
jgi:hypothetical protein